MRRRIDTRQFELFPNRMQPQAFFGSLVQNGLVAKTIRIRKPLERKPKTINVEKEVVQAYNALLKAKSLNPGLLVEELRKENASLDGILKNKAIIDANGLNANERAVIVQALSRILYYVKRQRDNSELKKIHAPSSKQYAQRSGERSHLKGIISQ